VTGQEINSFKIKILLFTNFICSDSVEEFEKLKFVKSKVFAIELVPLFLATILQVSKI